MVRFFGGSQSAGDSEIAEEAVEDFFNRRAERISELGPTRATIYQDNHPDLAERRDEAERRLLLPKLELDGNQRLLDVGCGTGRWVTTLSPLVDRYHGVDLTPGFIAHARSTFADVDNCRFSVGRAEDLTFQILNEDAPFDRILAAGLFIYLNDDQVITTATAFRNLLSNSGHCLLREPIAQQERLTLKGHYSDELAAEYHAIYRTREELMGAFKAAGLLLRSQGPLYDDPRLNNRAETRQEWMTLQVAES